jgi:hypothetical protein
MFFYQSINSKKKTKLKILQMHKLIHGIKNTTDSRLKNTKEYQVQDPLYGILLI